MSAVDRRTPRHHTLLPSFSPSFLPFLFLYLHVGLAGLDLSTIILQVTDDFARYVRSEFGRVVDRWEENRYAVEDWKEGREGREGGRKGGRGRVSVCELS